MTYNSIKEKENIIINKKSLNRQSSFSNNLLSFTSKEINSILRGKNNIVIKSKTVLKKYVLEALTSRNSNKNLYLGVIPKNIIERIIIEVTDISQINKQNLFKIEKEYQLAVNQEEIRHLKKESLSTNDVVNFIASLDELIINFDEVRYSKYNKNQNALRFKKHMSDGTHIAFEVISN